jgi:hypothetical protein
MPLTPAGPALAPPFTDDALRSVLGVSYAYRRMPDEGELYLTSMGLAHEEVLRTENWFDRDWFESHRIRLEGTSAVYRVPTRMVNGRRLHLVVKNCRVGEEAPRETRVLPEYEEVEFNSPWEEFALVMELREGRHGPPGICLQTQRPLAIYVPPEKMQPWQSGRCADRIHRIRAMQPGIELDILRQYKLVYEWIDGLNIVDALRRAGLEGEALNDRLRPLTRRAIRDLEQKGYAVMDMKPDHLILDAEEMANIDTIRGDTPEETTRRRVAALEGCIRARRYAVVDYELLIRTPAHEEEVTVTRRHAYLQEQRDRFIAMPLPAHLRAAEAMGVPYVWGAAESTRGEVWVVGRDGGLFDYFRPERWRKTPAEKLSPDGGVQYTVTKDRIHMVWKKSKIGRRPPETEDADWTARARELGYNSPFEEFGIAHDLASHGVPAVYVRAIYMTGSARGDPVEDPRRFETHRGLLSPAGQPALRADREHFTIRGYYNGSDQWVARQKGALYRPVNLARALEEGLIDRDTHARAWDIIQANLRNAGYDGSLLRGNDALFALDPAGAPVRNAAGDIEALICNFELIRKR